MSYWAEAEHKESAPKLTRREREFPECFEFEYGKSIEDLLKLEVEDEH